MSEARMTLIPVGEIYVDGNVRTIFDAGKLRELAGSIASNGVLEPLLVRPNGGRYQIVAGERRWRAAQIAGLEAVPCVVRPHMSDAQLLEAQLAENLHREDMNWVDEAKAVKKLKAKLQATDKVVAEKLCRSDFYVSMMNQLAELPKAAHAAGRAGLITRSVAYEIAKIETPELREAAAQNVLPAPGKPPLTISAAKQIIAETCGAGSKPRLRRPPAESIDNYAKHWRYWLLKMTPTQFESFKAVCAGRWEAEVMAEAVDVVMRGNSARDAAAAANGNGAKAGA